MLSLIHIYKIDADTRKGIYGVKFILYDAGKNPVGEYETDQDGYIWIDDELIPGKYYLRELETAEGYILDEQYKTVYVKRGHCAQITWENTAVTGQIPVSYTHLSGIRKRQLSRLIRPPAIKMAGSPPIMIRFLAPHAMYLRRVIKSLARTGTSMRSRM